MDNKQVMGKASSMSQDADGKWIALGANGFFASSTDGLEWIEHSLPSGISAEGSKIEIQNKIITISSDGRIFTYDSNGDNWIEQVAAVVQAQAVVPVVTVTETQSAPIHVLAGIRNMCKAAGLDDSMALKLYDQRMSAEVAGLVIQNLRASAEEIAPISNANPLQIDSGNGAVLMDAMKKVIVDLQPTNAASRTSF